MFHVFVKYFINNNEIFHTSNNNCDVSKLYVTYIVTSIPRKLKTRKKNDLKSLPRHAIITGNNTYVGPYSYRILKVLTI